MTTFRDVVELKTAPRVTIARGPHVIEIAPAAGGRVTRFATDTGNGLQDWLVPITLESWPADAWPKGGSYPLVPFSNRVRDSRFPAPDGERVELSTYPGMAHALHGFGQYAAWHVTRHDADCIVMRYAHREGEHGWPWAFEAEQIIQATTEGARLSMRVINHSARPMPVGIGFHPYFGAQEAELVATTDWRHEGEIAIEPLLETPAHRHEREQDGYTRYLSGWNGRATLSYADGRTLSLETEANGALNHVVVHCPAGAAYLCVEPVSHVSDGFNLDAQGLTGTGIVVIAPGSEIAASLVMAAGANRAPYPDDGAV